MEADDPRPWLRQAELDLEAAHLLGAGGRYEWAAFAAHQAAEKALKALLLRRGDQTRREHHALADLLRACRHRWPALKELLPAARALDWHYLLARYPSPRRKNRPPGEVYNERDYRICTDYAGRILAAVRTLLEEREGD